LIYNLASGILQNVSGLSTDLAVMTQSGPTALTNAGTLTGVLQLAGGAANEIFNQGMWHTAGGSSDFGGSATLTNMAGGTILAGGGTGPVTTAFNNLTGFENSGRLALRGAIVGNMLTTDANVELKAGSEVAIGINTAGGSDRLATSGTLAIGGKLAVSYTDGFGMNTRYTVATADGGVSGRWSAVTAYSAFLGLIDTYDANNAYLTASQIRPFADAGLTRNQIATATALDTMPGSGPLFDALTMQGSDAQARHAFDQLSGEIYSSAKAALVEESRFVREAATGRLRNAFGAVAAPAMAVMSYAADDSRGASGPMPKLPANDRLAVWGHAFGVWGQMDSDHNAASLHRSAGGFLLGADAPVADGWRAGLQTGYSRSHFEAKSRGAKLDSENYHLGVYAGAQWGQLGFRAGLAYTWHRLDATRNIAFEGFGDQARGKYDAGTFQTFGELGYRIDGWGASFEPFVNLASVNVTDDSFNERGGSAALRVDGKTADTAFNTLGLRGSKTFDIGGQRVTLSGMAGWRHAYGDVTPLSRNAFAGGNAFTVAGAPIARDALALEAAADIDLSRAMRIGLRYNGQIASAGDQHSVMANLTLRF
jgi:outer membrane autotransporter protein